MASALVIALLTWFSLQAVAAILRYVFQIRHLALGWFSFSWQITTFNRGCYNFGRRHSELRQWFGLGVLVAAMLGISAALILLRELWQALLWVEKASTVGESSTSEWAFGLIVPGVTVPWSHAIYLWIAAAVSIAVHEAGHALAAATEGVGLHHVALFSILLLPGAYVALDTETLAVLSPFRTLRIVCGGVWHNAVLCTTCWLLALLLPVLLWPAFSTGKGAVVRSVQSDSPLNTELGAADVITRINNCQVRSGGEWLGCLARATRGDSINIDRPGALTASQLLELMGQPAAKAGNSFCVSHELQAHSKACKASQDCAAEELCFQELRPWPRRLSGRASGSDGADSFRMYREAWRKKSNVITSSHANAGGESGEIKFGRAEGSCVATRQAASLQPCAAPGQVAEEVGGRCPSFSECLTPKLPAGEEILKVCYIKGFERAAAKAQAARKADWFHLHRQLKLHRKPVNLTKQESMHSSRRISSKAAAVTHSDFLGGFSSDKSCPEFLVYVGSRGSLLQAVVIESGRSFVTEVECFQAVGVSDFQPAASWISMRIPHILEQLLAYTFAVSAALALLNMAPIYGLDGEATLKALLLLWETRNSVQGAPMVRGHLQLGTRFFRLAVMNIGTTVFFLLLSLHALRFTGYDGVLTRLLTAGRHLLTFSVRWG